MDRTTIRTMVVLLAAAALAAAAVPARAAIDDASSPASVGGMTASLELRAQLRLVSIRAGACPPGVSSTTLCPSRTGEGSAPGLGPTAVAYSYLVDEAPSACSIGSVKVLGYPARLTVAGKGELQITVAELADCLAAASGISVDQEFAITGGTGIYAGAAGSGTVKRALGSTDAGAAGTETWIGTLTVPGLEFDVTRPTIAGAGSRVVRAKRGAKTARVSFSVTAQDDRDGTLATSCTVRSGSKFKIGRTRVSCSATDTSANTATAAFTVTVKKAR
jgi:HYR domain